jgi:hypothetical protein
LLGAVATGLAWALTIAPAPLKIFISSAIVFVAYVTQMIKSQPLCILYLFHYAMAITLEKMVNNSDKKSKEYKLALKYKKILDANKLTAEHLNTLEIEMMKIKLNKM